MEHISGQYIKHLREERGLTLRAFADLIYASKSSVYRWEQSTVPENADLLQKIAAVFETDVGSLRQCSSSFIAAQQAAEQAAASEADGAHGDEADDTADGEPGLDPDRIAEMKFGIKWLGWAVGLLAATALVLMAVFAAL